MKKTDFDKVNKLARKVIDSAGGKAEYHGYRVVLHVGDNLFVLCKRRFIRGSANSTFPEMEINSINEELAKQEAIQKLAMNGWSLVDNEKSVLEVERVYDTRYDCMAVPEGVRRAA